MRPENTLLLLLTISSILLPLASPTSIPDFRPFHPSRPLPPVDPLITPYCSKTEYPKVCINSARYFSQNFLSIEATNMFNIMAWALKDRIRFVQQRALAMSSSQKLNASVRGVMNECVDLYSNALDDLSIAMVGFVTRDKGTFEAKLDSVISKFQTCDKAFNGNPNPLSKEDDRLMKMTRNSITIGELSF